MHLQLSAYGPAETLIGAARRLLGAVLRRRREPRDPLGGEAPHAAAWPPGPPAGGDLPSHLLAEAAPVLGAPRLLLVWEDLDEPWLRLACWQRGEGSAAGLWREPPPAFQPVVAEPLAGEAFLASGLDGPAPRIWCASAALPRRWRGAPLNEDLRRRFVFGRAASWPLAGEAVTGRLFALDHFRFDRGFLARGQGVARRIAAELDRFYLIERMRSQAVIEERARVAGDLHDGLLQSLAATALQLEVLSRLLDGGPAEVCDPLREIQRSLAVDQRELRFLIEELRPVPRRSSPAESDLAGSLEELAGRLRRQCGLAVTFDLDGVRDGLPEGLDRQLYRLVRESLFNIARHAGAASARVEVRREGRVLAIEVTDDGRGFPFQGHFEHEELNRRKLGPVSLKERVSALGGSLAIDSGPGRTRLAMRLPAAGGER